MPSTTITDIHTVAIPVADQDRAVEFYVNALGFEKRLDAPIGPGMRWIEVAPPGADISIALTAAASDSPRGVDTGIRLTATDVEQEHAALSNRRVDVDEVLRWPEVPLMFSFRDADGNTLYVVETQH
jgi:catechol 2,3-dioxygenase-like lactoylglutathione lyase family enzyme